MPPKHRDSYHHGDLRQALVAAALDLLREGGPGALSLRSAARKAGVSPAAPYRHFADHSELMSAVAADGFRRLGAAMTQSSTSAKSPREALRALAREYVRFGVKHSAEYRVMFGTDTAGAGRYPELDETASSVFEMLEGGIRELQRGGFVRSGDPAAIALTAWSTMHGLVMLALDGRAPFDRKGMSKSAVQGRLEDQVSLTTELLMFGMAPRDGTKSSRTTSHRARRGRADSR